MTVSDPRISLAMIVKNEERFLSLCLESVQQCVDEIVIVDTGSTDRTMDIARAYGAKLGQMEWPEDFATARNAALSMATGDWVLSLDADERLVQHHWALVRKCVREAPPDCQGIFITCLSATPGPVDESPVLRLFRRLPHIRFEGLLHEEVGMTIQRAGGNLGQSQVCIVHDGYQAQIVEDKKKWERNERLLLLENFERPESGFTNYNLGHLYLVKKEPDKAQPYFLDSLRLSSPANLYWSRLVQEATMCGIVVPGTGRMALLPPDPVTVFRLHPDPLMRAA